jgi:hypothetical protein
MINLSPKAMGSIAEALEFRYDKDSWKNDDYF